MKHTILEIKDLSYSYDSSRLALSGIHLSIQEGEKIAVIGANGAGKSTFFLTMNGVIQPDSGEIRYRGTTITKKNRNEIRKAVGIVFQEADHQIIAPTVEAELSFGPMNLKLDKEEVRNRVNDTLSYMNLTEFKNRPPHYLSGGEKKRVTIGDIIAMQSEMMLFDEPASSLDPVNTQRLEQILKQLHEDGKTLLISTHDVDFTYRWAERVIVFWNGQIIADGSPLSVFQNTAVLEKANLKKPILLEVVEKLMENQCLPNGNFYPKSVEEFDTMLKEGRKIENFK